jgi:hypothetical protein
MIYSMLNIISVNSNNWNNPVYRRKSRLLPASIQKLALKKLIRQLTDQTPPFGRQTGSIFALLASLTVGSHLFFGSPDKVGRPRDSHNLTIRFADYPKKSISFRVTKKPILKQNGFFKHEYI